MTTTRRALLGQAAALIAGSGGAWGQETPDYGAVAKEFFDKSQLMGLQAAVVANGLPAWTGAYGLADAAPHIPMSPDTVMNIASVSKTVTATAVMRLVWQKTIALDDDVNQHLTFTVRNPLHDSHPITVRHLLAHISSVADGPAYAQSYVCGPAAASLSDWLTAYFAKPDRANFHPWPPGQKFAYSNVGFGLLGLIVATVSGQSFAAFCESEIFAPLGMKRSSAGPAKVAPDQQAIAYTLAAKADRAGRVMPARGTPPAASRGQGFIVNCGYSFPNAPDGLVRTCANDFAAFLAAVANEGKSGAYRLIGPKNLGLMFEPQFANAERPQSWPTAQGLAWYAFRAPDGSYVWMHGGADPGVGTLAMLHRPSKSAVALFANTAPAEGLDALAGALLKIAATTQR